MAIAILSLVAVVRVTSTYRVFSQTFDEPIHIAAGLQWLTNGGTHADPEHPPLARILFGLGPYLEGARVEDGPAYLQGNAVLYGGGRYGHTLSLARLGNLFFFLLALAVVTVWSWRLFGRAAAIVALALFGSLPPVLGHAGLATTDMAAAATTAAALLALALWLDEPRWGTALLLGAATGVGLASKYSFAVFFPAAAAVFVVLSLRRLRQGAGLRTRQVALAIGVAVAIVWATFRFDVGTINAMRLKVFPVGDAHNVATAYARVHGYEWVRPDLIERYRLYSNAAARRGRVGIDFVDWAKAAGYPSPLAGRSGRDTMAGAPPISPTGRADKLLEPFRRAGQWLAAEMPLPAPMFAIGLITVSRHSSIGHPSFLLGRYSNTGWWYYFPVVLFFKTPLPFLGLALAGMALLVRRGGEAAAVGLAPIAMLLPAMHSSLNIGVRHVLPVHPLMTIAAAVAVTSLWRGQRLGRAAAAALLGWYFIGSAAAHPDYMAYFNEASLGHPERIAADSNLDWGQDLLRLADVVRQRRIRHLHLRYFGTAEYARHLPADTEWMTLSKRVDGWIAISEQNMILDSGHPVMRNWLLEYEPVERIGKSIRLYHIPPLDPLVPRS
jgi:4-amino-4-deoxy-L-arabinose transferase-like glycosyltransferase